MSAAFAAKGSPGELENLPGENDVLKYLDSEDETTTPSQERGVMGRLAITAALTLALLGAVRWASDITSANAKQVSKNLSEIQTTMGPSAQAADIGTTLKTKKSAKGKRRTEKPERP